LPLEDNAPTLGEVDTVTGLVSALAVILALAAPAAATDKETEAAAAEAFFQVLKGRPEEAERIMMGLVRDHPTAEAWAARARVQLRVENVDGAAASAAEAVKAAAVAPEARAAVAEAHALLGEAYRAVGNAKHALAAYSTAVALAPDDLGRRATYGLLLGINGQHEAGVAELKRVTADAAYKDVDAWMNLGWVYRNMDPPRTDESAAAYEMALKIDPKNAGAVLGLGWAHLIATRYDLARKAFTRAIDLAQGATPARPTRASAGAISS
jgi:tetratricopeptide (TPR) repeat protein